MSLSSWHSETPKLRLKINNRAVISTLLSFLLAIPAFAQESAEVAKLLHAGQLEAALARVDDFLARRPSDAQMRFLKGLILTEKQKVTEAISIFTGLCEDFPDSPEPFNNLAVLLATNGEFEKSRVALDAAIRTHPTYATTYENMNQVQTRLTGSADHRPLLLGAGITSTKSKLTLLWSLERTDRKTGNTSMALALTEQPKGLPMNGIDRTVLPSASVVRKSVPPGLEAGSSAPTPATIAHQQLATAEPKSEKSANNENAVRDRVPSIVRGWSKALSDENLADVRVKLESQDDGKVPPVKANDAERNNSDAMAAPAPAPTPLASEAITPAPNLATTEKQQFDKADLRPERSAGDEEADRNQVLNAVIGWSRAWSGRDVENYLSYYGNDFQTLNREPLTAWANKRRIRISAQGRINIEVDSPRVTINGNTAIVKFRQIYISDNLKSNIYKTLTLTKKNEVWKISKEKVDN
jgi:tetratricopeptide (TPR) repeat protein